MACTADYCQLFPLNSTLTLLERTSGKIRFDYQSDWFIFQYCAVFFAHEISNVLKRHGHIYFHDGFWKHITCDTYVYFAHKQSNPPQRPNDIQK